MANSDEQIAALMQAELPGWYWLYTGDIHYTSFTAWDGRLGDELPEDGQYVGEGTTPVEACENAIQQVKAERQI